MKRRKLLTILPALPMGGTLLLDGGSAPGRTSPEQSADEKVIPTYERIGVRPVINARGTVTILGATRVLPEVRQAMDAAVRQYVQIDELMEAVGRRLAQLTGAQWGCVTAGASAALTMATAGCITKGDPDKLWQLPDLKGLRDEVIIPRYSRSAYDAAARCVGTRMVEVNSIDELKHALSHRTALIMVLAGARSANGPLSLPEISALAKPLDIPVVVDAAAEEIRVPNPHLSQGADLVVYSGGKCMRGPQCAGLLLGRKDLVTASWMCSAPHHGFGRGYKVGREEIMGMLTAVEMWMRRDHQAEQKMWSSWADFIGKQLRKIKGVTTALRPPQGLSNHFPVLDVRWDLSVIPLTGEEVEALLWDGQPRIAVSGAGSFLPFPPNQQPNISITTSQLEAGEEKVIAKRLYAILSNPQPEKKPSAAPSSDTSGEWHLVIQFAAGTGHQKLLISQNGNALKGSHITDFAPREMTGTLYGNDLVMRSSYTREGIRLNFTFTGKAEGNTMHGDLSMGEYGTVPWKATRK